jgi:uncharacterized protein
MKPSRLRQALARAAKELYVFGRLGRSFAVHVPSGDFFALDEIGRVSIEALKSQSLDDALSAIRAQFGDKKSEELLADLAGLAASAEAHDDGEPGADEPAVEMTDLTLNVVNHCNLACVYCWNERGTYGGGRGPAAMPPEVATRAVDLLVETSRGADGLVVDFYGGEPLLNRPAMKAALDHCAAIARDRGIRFSFLIATNGVLLDRPTAEWLHEHRVNVAISIDGNKNVQDAQRPLLKGGSSFDQVWKNLQSIPESIRADYVARATLTPRGPGAPATYRMLSDLGFRRIEVFESEAACFGLPMEHAENFYLTPTDRDRLKGEYEELVSALLQKVAGGELVYRDLFFMRIFKQMARLVRNGDFQGPCAAGLGQIAVDTEGYVYPCTAFIGQDEWRMGHLDRGLDAAVQDTIRACDILASADCATCWAKNLCLGSGSCFNLNYFNHQDIGKPVPEHCELYRFKVEILIAALALLEEMNPDRFEALFAPGHFEDRTAWSPASGR